MSNNFSQTTQDIINTLDTIGAGQDQLRVRLVVTDKAYLEVGRVFGVKALIPWTDLWIAVNEVETVENNGAKWVIALLPVVANLRNGVVTVTVYRPENCTPTDDIAPILRVASYADVVCGICYFYNALAQFVGASPANMVKAYLDLFDGYIPAGLSWLATMIA